MSRNGPDDLTALCVSAEAMEVVVFSYRLENPSLDALTATERDVVLHAYQGLSNAEIAAVRKRSVRTIANQLAHAFRKLGVQSRRELVALLSSHDPATGTAP